jgi:hypothetical protein
MMATTAATMTRKRFCSRGLTCFSSTFLTPDQVSPSSCSGRGAGVRNEEGDRGRHQEVRRIEEQPGSCLVERAVHQLRDAEREPHDQGAHHAGVVAPPPEHAHEEGCRYRRADRRLHLLEVLKQALGALHHQHPGDPEDHHRHRGDPPDRHDARRRGLGPPALVEIERHERAR